MQCVSLDLRIVSHRPARLLPERLRDLHLRIDFLLHLVRIKDFADAGLGIAGSHRLVPGNAGDRRLCAAAGVAAVLAETGTAAARRQFTVQTDTRANIDAK